VGRCQSLGCANQVQPASQPGKQVEPPTRQDVGHAAAAAAGDGLRQRGGKRLRLAAAGGQRVGDGLGRRLCLRAACELQQQRWRWRWSLRRGELGGLQCTTDGKPLLSSSATLLHACRTDSAAAHRSPAALALLSACAVAEAVACAFWPYAWATAVARALAVAPPLPKPSARASAVAVAWALPEPAACGWQ
jgi:hypothetical protein